MPIIDLRASGEVGFLWESCFSSFHTVWAKSGLSVTPHKVREVTLHFSTILEIQFVKSLALCILKGACIFLIDIEGSSFQDHTISSVFV